MCLKEISALAVSFALCIPFAKAEKLHNHRDSIVYTSSLHSEIENNTAGLLNFQTIDTLTIDYTSDAGHTYFESIMAKRLSPLTAQLESEASNNESVQNYINKFSANNYRFHLSKMLGLSTYYFPIFERALKETGVPLEIKYLTIIESSLDPHAVSRMGATGPWQFMYATAKEFGLTIDSYIDERKDPISASYAAANYLKSAYDSYKDWLLAIASYNCGQGNVNRAIKRSGLENPSFWDIQHLLPGETRNYVPAFIAMCHVLSNHKDYGITPDPIDLELNTEVIMVDRPISLSVIADALSINESEIIRLNPSYKRKIINASKDNVQRLIVPQVDRSAYSDLYYALQGSASQTKLVHQANLASITGSVTKSTSSHRVKKGETLEKIALQHQVTIQDLKAWNHLKSTVIVPGQSLKLNTDPSSRIAKASSKSKSPQYITYKVKKGDTLSGIAQKYKIPKVSTLKAMNNLKSNNLQPGMTLKVSNI